MRPGERATVAAHVRALEAPLGAGRPSRRGWCACPDGLQLLAVQLVERIELGERRSTTTTRITTPAGGALVAIGPIPTTDRSPAGTFGTAPTVTVPSGAPPTHLESADLITGTGAPAAPGDSVTVQYVLATYSTGKVVQSSWTSQPYTFTLGEGHGDPRDGTRAWWA